MVKVVFEDFQIISSEGSEKERALVPIYNRDSTIFKDVDASTADFPQAQPPANDVFWGTRYYNSEDFPTLLDLLKSVAVAHRKCMKEQTEREAKMEEDEEEEDEDVVMIPPAPPTTPVQAPVQKVCPGAPVREAYVSLMVISNF